MPPQLFTPRLCLRPLEPQDAPTLHRIYEMPGVLRYFPSTTPPTLEKVQRFIAGQANHWQEQGYGNWGILPNGETEIIGWAGLQFLPELNETEVGFLLAPSHWGKGYATEAALASLQFGFQQTHFAHITALVHPQNLASQRVVQKCAGLYLETIHLWGIDLLRYRIERNELT